MTAAELTRGYRTEAFSEQEQASDTIFMNFDGRLACSLVPICAHAPSIDNAPHAFSLLRHSSVREINVCSSSSNASEASCMRSNSCKITVFAMQWMVGAQSAS